MMFHVVLLALVSIAGATMIDLGTVDSVSADAVYPGPCMTVNRTLIEVVENYYSSTIKHDGINAEVSIYVWGVEMFLNVTSKSNIFDYAKAIAQWRETKTISKKGEVSLRNQKLWLESWKVFPNWEYPLINPLVIQVTQNPSLDSVCKRTSYTSTRVLTNLRMLEVNLNSDKIVRSTMLDPVRFINFKNIFPVATDWEDSNMLNSTHYSPFVESTLDTFALALSRNPTAPVVFYGHHVKQWVWHLYKVDLKYNTVGRLKLRRDIPDIWYTYAHDPTEITSVQVVDEVVDIGVEDLITACWMSNVHLSPTSDKNEVMSKCRVKWSRDMKLACTTLMKIVFNASTSRANFLCKGY